MKLSDKGKNKLENYLHAYGAYIVGLRSDEPSPIKLKHDDFKNGALTRLIEHVQEGLVLTDAEAVSLKTLQLKIRQVEKRE